MKVKELIEQLRQYDGELEVQVFHDIGAIECEVDLYTGPYEDPENRKLIRITTDGLFVGLGNPTNYDCEEYYELVVDKEIPEVSQIEEYIKSLYEMGVIGEGNVNLLDPSIRTYKINDGWDMFHDNDDWDEMIPEIRNITPNKFHVQYIRVKPRLIDFMRSLSDGDYYDYGENDYENLIGTLSESISIKKNLNITNKIKELVTQEMDSNYYSFEEEDSGYFGPESTEASLGKFAEHIIKESIDALEKECGTLDCNNEYEMCYQRGFAYAISYLSKHFEIKPIEQHEPKICPNKANGNCPSYNLFCQYPNCEN